jgi:hypothetical protein
MDEKMTFRNLGPTQRRLIIQSVGKIYRAQQRETRPRRPIEMARAKPKTDRWINRREIRSETSNRVYVIAQERSTGQWQCSCPGWITRRHCKHLASTEQARTNFMNHYRTSETPNGDATGWNQAFAPSRAVPVILDSDSGVAEGKPRRHIAYKEAD